MSKETFRIRIKRDGTIHFSTNELGHERMRQLREMIEDCMGPIVEVRSPSDDDGMAPSVKYADKKKEEHRSVEQ